MGVNWRGSIGEERLAFGTVGAEGRLQQKLQAARTLAADTLEQLTNHWKQQDAGGNQSAARQALATYCHAVFNLAEFLYID